MDPSKDIRQFMAKAGWVLMSVDLTGLYVRSQNVRRSDRYD